MKSPQTENGFTKIANELFDEYIKISRHLSPYENTIWLCILRQTYGFHKKADWLSLSQIEKITGIRQPHVARTKKKLIQRNMITCEENRLGIQKDYDLWIYPNRYTQIGIGIPKQVLPKQVISLTQTGNLGLPKQVDTKDTITKDITTKDIYSHDSPEYKLSTLLLNLILERRPTLKKPDIQKWCIEVNRMIRLEKRKYDEIEKVIQWCQKDDFWKNNILSIGKLRKQYDQLALKMESQPKQEKYESIDERNQRMIAEMKKEFGE